MIDENNDIPLKIKRNISKTGIFVGILLIIFAIAWIAAKMGLIPQIIFDMWLQIVLILLGIFIVYKSFR